MRQSDAGLPAGVTVFERGWLSANNILFTGPEGSALVDSGYCTHAVQTVGLVQRALGDRSLDALINTHLHSDHCGGNAALQATFPRVKTLVPPGLADAVRRWDPVALTYEPTGQSCPRFRIEGVIAPGAQLLLGGNQWQVHAAPGHDPHSVILFEPKTRVLISADALWEKGFGIVFPELEGEEGFDDVAATFDVIEALAPLTIIPGHGAIFSDVAAALQVARKRLSAYRGDPSRHAAHAAKVLLKFRLLEVQAMSMTELEEWAGRTPYFGLVFARYFGDKQLVAWLQSLAANLVKSGAAEIVDGRIVNA